MPKLDDIISELLAGPSTLVSQAKLLRERQGRKIPKPIKPPRTKTLEMSYLRELNGLVRLLIQLTNDIVIPQIGPIVEGAERIRPILDAVRTRGDDFSDEIDDVMATLRIQYFRAVPEREEAAIAARQADRVNRQNSRYFDRLSRQITTVNIARFEPWLSGELHSFTTANVKHIKAMAAKYTDRVESIITEGVRRGKLGPEIAREIQGSVKFKIPGEYKKLKNKAKLIARDQTSKLNGDLNRLRQTNAGIKEYIWETALDRRVRSSHKSKHGKRFRWSQSPTPGSEIMCRCIALPIIPD